MTTPIRTYGNREHCQGCDQDRDCLPYLVHWDLHWDHLDVMEHASDEWEITQRAYYCPVCAEQVEREQAIQGWKVEEFAVDWRTVAAELVLHASSVVLRLDLADIEKGSPLCSALREPLRHAIIDMRRAMEE